MNRRIGVPYRMCVGDHLRLETLRTSCSPNPHTVIMKFTNETTVERIMAYF